MAFPSQVVHIGLNEDGSFSIVIGSLGFGLEAAIWRDILSGMALNQELVQAQLAMVLDAAGIDPTDSAAVVAALDGRTVLGFF